MSNDSRLKLLAVVNNKNVMRISLIVLIIMTLVTCMFPIEIDLTINNSNSISKEARSILKSMDIREDELKVIYFSAIINSGIDTNAEARIKKVFEQFGKYNKKIKYEIIDLTKEPEALSQYKVADTKSVLICYKNKKICIPFETFACQVGDEIRVDIESKLIDEFIKLKDDENYKIYYTAGHGEKLDSDEYAEFKTMLLNLGYKFEKVNLEKSKLDDAKNMYIIAPDRDFTKEEIKKLEKYLANGNSLFITLSTSSKVDSDILTSYPNLDIFYHKYGINVLNRVVVDQIQGMKLIGVYADEDEEAKIVEGVNPIVDMPHARMMSIVPSKNGYKAIKTMLSGELTSFPLVVKLTNNKSKILVVATPEVINNTNIKNNSIFATYLVKWVDNFNTNINIEPFIYKEYKANPNEFKPALILGIIDIMIPLLALYLGYEMSRKRIMSINTKNEK